MRFLIKWDKGNYIIVEDIYLLEKKIKQLFKFGYEINSIRPIKEGIENEKKGEL